MPQLQRADGRPVSGPARKPEAERKRSSSRAPIVMIKGRIGTPPPAPEGVLAVTRKAWESFWRSSQAKYVSPHTDLMPLIRLFRLYDEQERAYRQLTKKGAMRVVEGSKGQPRLSPLYGLLDRLDAKITAIEDRFGLSPRARQNLGMKPDADGPTLDDLNEGLGEPDEAEGDQPAVDDVEDPRHIASPRRRRRAG